MDIRIVPEGPLLDNFLAQLHYGFQQDMFDKRVTPLISLNRGKGKEQYYYFFTITMMGKGTGDILEIQTPIYISNNQKDEFSKVWNFYLKTINHQSKILNKVSSLFTEYGIHTISIRCNEEFKKIPQFETFAI